MSKRPHYFCPLQKLYLNENPQITAKGWRLFSENIFMLARNSLKTIELRNCGLDELRLQQILSGMQKAYSKEVQNKN